MPESLAEMMEVENASNSIGNDGTADRMDIFVQRNSFLETLPGDAMDVVLSCLTLLDFEKLSVVSRRMNDAVSLSSHLYMSRSTYLAMRQPKALAQQHMDRQPTTPQDDLRKLLRRFYQLNVLHLQGLAPVGDDVVSILNEYSAASNLKQLSLHGCALSYWCPQSFRFENLEHISLSGNSIRARMGALLKSSPNLKSLSIGQCSALRDDDMADIGLSLYSSLQNLTLNQCIRVNQPQLRFPNLVRLNMVGCFGLDNLSGFSCPQLRYLNLSFCVRISGHQIQQLVSRALELEELVLMKCSGIYTLNLCRPRLKRLNVSFCHKLRDLRIDCPSLQELENSACSTLETIIIMNASCLHNLDFNALSALQRLEIRSQCLKCLNLQGCKSLDDCQIHCPSLQHVNLRGSRTVALRFCKSVRRVLFRSWFNV